MEGSAILRHGLKNPTPLRFGAVNFSSFLMADSVPRRIRYGEGEKSGSHTHILYNLSVIVIRKEREGKSRREEGNAIRGGGQRDESGED